jgi:hypothetical protein
MIQPKTMFQINKLLNNFRGVFVEAIMKGEKDDSWTIDFQCWCKDSLIGLLSTANNTPLFFSLSCSDYKTIDYTMHLEDVQSTAVELVDLFKFLFKTNTDFRERWKLTDYSELNKVAKIKYVQFVKQVRSHYDDGLFSYDAKEVLDSMRHCAKCKNEIFTNEDLLRNLFDSENIDSLYVKLTEIECKNCG